MRAGIALALLAAGLAAGPEAPSGGIEGIGYIDDGAPVAEARVSADEGGRRGSPEGGGRRPARRGRTGTGETPRCRVEPLPAGTVILESDGRPRPAPPGGWGVAYCQDGEGLLIRPGLVAARTSAARAVAADPEALARRALARLPLPLPGVVTSPPADRDQLVGLPTWLALEGGWEPRSTTAALPGVSVTVTATPARVRWDMGDGGVEVCRGPGVAYDPALPAASQSTDCSYTYPWPSTEQPDERYRGRATLTWTASYTVSDGGGGDLGEVSRSAEFALRVAEGQALVTSGGR